ncbi:MAG TPA: DUF454 family protein [Thermoanaerobaculia bacterium]
MPTLTEAPAETEREELPPERAPARQPERSPGERATASKRPRRRFRALPWKTRAVLATAGVLLLVLGVAGLFLPFLQGILFLLIAAAVLSLASERVYGWLRGLVAERWPGAWRRVERFRTRVLWKFRR